jgi:hypothetical protein
VEINRLAHSRLQEGRAFDAKQALPVTPAKGWLLIIDRE